MEVIPWISITFFVIFFIYFTYHLENYLNPKDIIYNFIIGAVTSIIITIIFSFISIFIILQTNVKERSILIYKSDIISLNNKSEIRGSFVLGCGSINDVGYYFYYEKVNNLLYKQNQVTVSSAYIKQTNNEIPNIAYYENRLQSKWLGLIKGIDYTTIGYYYIITVPKNSIIEEFKL